MLLSATPFILQAFELLSFTARLDIQREMSAQPRQDQAIVVNFENEWGAINDFPDQGVREAMFSLQGVLSPERLSSLEISDGLIFSNVAYRVVVLPLPVGPVIRIMPWG